MNQQKHVCLSVCILCAVPLWAPVMRAQSLSPDSPRPDGWYGSLSSGASFGYSVDVESEAFTVEIPGVLPGIPIPAIEVDPIEISVDTDTGFGVNGAIGYQFEQARAELELGYNRNRVNHVDVTGLPRVDVDGRFDVWSVSANAYYDVPTGNALRPYIGGGIGVARLSAEDVAVEIPVLGRSELDDSGVSPIFQAKAGIAYDFSERASAFIGYQLQGIPGQRFQVETVDFDANTVLIHHLQVGANIRF